MSQPEVYVSITGLQVRRVWHIPAFWTHAIRAMVQARGAPGNISAQARRIDGVHHTLTVWTDRKAMLGYLRTGPHRDAIRLFPRIATGKVLGFCTQEVPDWADVPALWAAHGREV